jgi:AraC-like DNA-binding protein
VAGIASNFRSPARRERLGGRAAIARHRHREGYVTVILSGGYVEAGFDGRRHFVAGDVVAHGPYDAHLDHVAIGGAELINLPLPPGSDLPAAFTVEDVDAIARLAESDAFAAVSSLRPKETIASRDDWVDLLAAELVSGPSLRLNHWAEQMGFAAETLSRGFRSAYGVTPARFRLEARTRKAMSLVEGTDLGLAAIAADCDFSDQSHLTRSILELTGQPPGRWRRKSIAFKNGGHSPA